MGSDCVLSGLCYLGLRIRSKHSNIFSKVKLLKSWCRTNWQIKCCSHPNTWPCPRKRKAAWQLLNLSVQCVKEDDYTFKTDLKRRWIFCTFDILRNKQSFWQMVFMLANGFFMLFLFCIVKQAFKLMLFCFKNLQIGNSNKTILIIVIGLKTILY